VGIVEDSNNGISKGKGGKWKGDGNDDDDIKDRYTTVLGSK
jgi:hypothetical protein